MADCASRRMARTASMWSLRALSKWGKRNKTALVVDASKASQLLLTGCLAVVDLVRCAETARETGGASSLSSSGSIELVAPASVREPSGSCIPSPEQLLSAVEEGVEEMRAADPEGLLDGRGHGPCPASVTFAILPQRRGTAHAILQVASIPMDLGIYSSAERADQACHAVQSAIVPFCANAIADAIQ